eukprot:15730-Heterococcus_DN1.PRE.1
MALMKLERSLASISMYNANACNSQAHEHEVLKRKLRGSSDHSDMTHSTTAHFRKIAHKQPRAQTTLTLTTLLHTLQLAAFHYYYQRLYMPPLTQTTYQQQRLVLSVVPAAAAITVAVLLHHLGLHNGAADAITEAHNRAVQCSELAPCAVV